MANDIPKQAGVKPLLYIPQLVSMDLNDPTTTHHMRYLQWAILGFKDLQMFAINNVKVVYCPIKSNKTIDLPMDYLKYTKIGLCMGDGNCSRVITLGLNDTLCLSREHDDCGDDIVNAIAATVSEDELVGYYNTYYPFVEHWHNGQYIAGIYGLGGGFHKHYYREDKERNTIQFDSDVPGGVIVLEYISTGIDSSGNTLIPVAAVQTLRAYTHYERVLNKKGSAKWEIEYRQGRFTSELKLLQSFDSRMTMDEYIDLFRFNIHQLPKR